MNSTYQLSKKLNIKSNTKFQLPLFPYLSKQFYTPQIFTAFKKKNIHQIQNTSQNYHHLQNNNNNIININSHIKTQYNHLQDAFNQIIYQKFHKINQFPKQKQLNLNFIKCQQKIVQNKILPIYQTDKIVFDSHFQSANLLMVSKIALNSYNLLIQNDINTLGYTNWFFFKITSLDTSKKKIHFNILNLSYLKQLYSQGLKIVVFSQNKFQTQRIGWHYYNTSSLKYYKNKLIVQALKNKDYYTLQWQYQISPNDEVFFASNFPYTFSDLNSFLQNLQKNQSLKKKSYFNKFTLCKTILSNQINCIHISNTDQKFIQKKSIFMIGRIHPGQTISSYILQYIIKLLNVDQISSQNYIIYLRKKYNFYVIPMLNPDGVIVGNNRCNLLGKDLNKQWNNAQNEIVPQITNLKKLIEQDKNIQMIIDFHETYRKKGIFIHGNHDQRNPFRTRLFPFILAEIYGSRFSYRDSNFNCKIKKHQQSRKNIQQNTKYLIYKIYISSIGQKGELYSVKTYKQIASKILEALGLYSQNSNTINYNQINGQNQNFNHKLLYSRESMILKLMANTNNYEVGLHNQYTDSQSDFEQQQYLLNQHLKSKILNNINGKQLLIYKTKQFQAIMSNEIPLVNQIYFNQFKKQNTYKSKSPESQINIEQSIKIRRLLSNNLKSIKIQSQKISSIINKCRSDRSKIDKHKKIYWRHNFSQKRRTVTLSSELQLNPIKIQQKKLQQKDVRKHKRYSNNSQIQV